MLSQLLQTGCHLGYFVWMLAHKVLMLGWVFFNVEQTRLGDTELSRWGFVCGKLFAQVLLRSRRLQPAIPRRFPAWIAVYQFPRILDQRAQSQIRAPCRDRGGIHGRRRAQSCIRWSVSAMRHHRTAVESVTCS